MTFHSLCAVITLAKQLFNYFFLTPPPSFGLGEFCSLIFCVVETVSWLFKKRAKESMRNKSDFIPSCARWAEASPGPGDLWAQSYCAQVNLRQGKNLFTQLVGWEVIHFIT